MTVRLTGLAARALILAAPLLLCATGAVAQTTEHRIDIDENGEIVGLF